VVPRQYSTGGKQKLFGISKRGNIYLRRMNVALFFKLRSVQGSSWFLINGIITLFKRLHRAKGIVQRLLAIPGCRKTRTPTRIR
jgi:transposase